LQKFGGFPVDLKRNVLRSMPTLIGFNLPKKKQSKVNQVRLHISTKKTGWDSINIPHSEKIK